MQQAKPFLLILVFIFNILSTNGEWDKFKWISNSDIESNLFRLTPLRVADGSGEAMNFCRAKFEGHFYPGKFSHHDRPFTCTITGNGRSHVRTSDFEVLYTPDRSVEWASGNGRIPEYAFAVGTDRREGRHTHLGKVNHNGREILGRIVGHRCFFTDGSGTELNSRNYEVLILTYAARKTNILTYGPY